MNPWHWLLDTLRWGLTEFHDLFFPFTGEHSWGWAIVALTLVIRIFLLPLAAKQFKSMRGMQALSPEMQKIKKKYKVDRDLMKKDPEKYKAQRQKMNEEVMGLYQEHGVNPAASCLPLLLQAPIFFALFRILWYEGHQIPAMANAPFYVFSPLDQAANASVWGWLMVVAMAATMFVTQYQMMGANPATEGMQATQQKVMLYGMPVFLAVVAQNLPKGVLVYWVTTNLWQLTQQQLILRQLDSGDDDNGDEDARGAKGSKAGKGSGPKGSSGKGSGGKGSGPKGSGGKGSGGKASEAKGKKKSRAQDEPGDRQPKKKASGAAGAKGSDNGERGSSKRPSGNGQRRDRADRDDHLPRRRPRRDGN